MLYGEISEPMERFADNARGRSATATADKSIGHEGKEAPKQSIENCQRSKLWRLDSGGQLHEIGSKEMIYDRGVLMPTRQQIELLRRKADDSFCMTMEKATFGQIPRFEGLVAQEITALTLYNVEPHDDPWVGDHDDRHGEDGPEARRAAFWLVHTAVDHALHLQCGGHAVRMTKGSWVVFDDRILHGVYSRRKWWGLAFQLRPTTLGPKG